MTIRKLDLHVPMSEDGETVFSELADILDHLATLYGWEPNAYAFLVSRAEDARHIDRVYEHKLPINTFDLVREHKRAYPKGCAWSDCDVCHVG